MTRTKTAVRPGTKGDRARPKAGWWGTFVHELPYYIVLGIMIFAFRSTFAENYVIPSGSMEPTLKVGDYLFALKCAYDLHVPFTGVRLAHFGNVQRGDIIIFPSVHDPDTKLIKRVIGVAGDRIEIRKDRVYLNGQPLERRPALHHAGLYDLPDAAAKDLFIERIGDVEHYVFQIRGWSRGDFFGPITVPPGNLFVMGDNRDNSLDSRAWGFVPEDSVLGRAGIIYMSWDKKGHNADGSQRPRWLWRLRHERLGRVVR